MNLIRQKNYEAILHELTYWSSCKNMVGTWTTCRRDLMAAWQWANKWKEGNSKYIRDFGGQRSTVLFSVLALLSLIYISQPRVCAGSMPLYSPANRHTTIHTYFQQIIMIQGYRSAYGPSYFLVEAYLLVALAFCALGAFLLHRIKRAADGILLSCVIGIVSLMIVLCATPIIVCI